jgi:hypothetical protein
VPGLGDYPTALAAQGVYSRIGSGIGRNPLSVSAPVRFLSRFIHADHFPFRRSGSDPVRFVPPRPEYYSGPLFLNNGISFKKNAGEFGRIGLTSSGFKLQ